MSTRIRPDSLRRQPGYKPLPKEAWLKTQVMIIAADWPTEGRINLVEAVIDTLGSPQPPTSAAGLKQRAQRCARLDRSN